MQNDKNNQNPYKHTQQDNYQNQGYLPDADPYWYQHQMNPNLYKRPKPWSTQKKVGLGILIAIGALLYLGLMVFNLYRFSNANSFRRYSSGNSISVLPTQVQSSILGEASSISLTISNAISQYQAINGSIDLSGLNVPYGTIDEGFIPGSPLYDKLNLTYFDLSNELNLDPEDFYIVFDTDGTDGRYKIICDASKSLRNGTNTKGLNIGVFEFDPATKTTTVK